MVKGLVAKCDNNLNIKELLFNSLLENSEPGALRSLYDIVAEDEKSKLTAFREDLDKQGVVLEHEINLHYLNLPLPLKFTGGKVEDGYFVFLLKTNDDIPFLYEELMKVNNEQANFLRSLVSEQVQTTTDKKDREALFDDISRMNNELTNLHRQLESKNAELTRLNRLKDEFLGIAAHDLRNPLTSILFYLDFIMEEPDHLSDDQLEHMKQVGQLSKSMLNLVNELLDVSAIERGRIRLNAEQLVLNDLVEKTIHSYRNLADNKGIETIIEHHQQKVMINADPARITQVLVNLYSNAVKFSDRNTLIRVEVKRNDSGGQIILSDQGRGIEKEEQELLFHPFQQTTTLSTENEKGSGLGLFIVKKIIEAHHGEITVQSEPGKGSSFFISLP